MKISFAVLIANDPCRGRRSRREEATAGLEYDVVCGELIYFGKNTQQKNSPSSRHYLIINPQNAKVNTFIKNEILVEKFALLNTFYSKYIIIRAHARTYPIHFGIEMRI